MKTKWLYQIRVSKDSPKNTYRGMWNGNTPNTEYHRGYTHGVSYTTLKEANNALLYFQKGSIIKFRTVIDGCSRSREEKTVKTL